MAAKAETGRPSFIALRTIIGWPAPNKQNTGKAHGSALGADEVAATKEILGFDPDRAFDVADDVLAHARGVVERGPRRARRVAERLRRLGGGPTPTRARAVRAAVRRARCPTAGPTALPEFPAERQGHGHPQGVRARCSTRSRPVLPELWGGSADLAESNNTTMEGEPSFIPPEHATKAFPGDWYGRTLHFGIREHGMGAILNGIALHGGTRPYGGTFLVFSDYMRPAVRLAALMKLPVIYVWTHDSIGLGEDGPTHQPIEHLAALRAIPGLDVVRPADANETAWAWRIGLEHTDRPTGAVPDPAEPARCSTAAELRRRRRRGQGRLHPGRGAHGQPAGDPHRAPAPRCRSRWPPGSGWRRTGTPTRVVSMPCREWFDAQDAAYRAAGAAAGGEGPGQRRGGRRDVVAAIWSARPASA